MPRKASGNFDQHKYNAEWSRKNMGRINVQYRKEFIQEFKDACSKLGIKQSDIIRKAMQETIEAANGKDN